MATKPEVIIVYKSIAGVVVSNATTFAVIAGMIGLGWLIDSSAAQWIGAILGFLVIGVRAAKLGTRCTIAEARKRLDEIEGVA